MPHEPRGVEELVQAVARAPRGRSRPPRAAFEYSNTDYVLLGSIAEQIEGRPLGVIFDERLLGPLGLRGTHFLPSSPPATLRPGFDRALMPFPWGYVHRPECTSWETLAQGSGALASNARDLAWFLRALVRGRIVGQAALRSMTDFRPCAIADTPAIRGVACGLFLYEADGSRYWGHAGLMIGSESIALYCPQTGVTTAVVGNVSRFDVLGVALELDRAR